MNWPLLGGSLAAILMLAGAARLLGLGGARLVDEADAVRVAEEILTDFEGQEAHLAADGSGAVVLGAGGDTVAIRRHGARFLARRVARPARVSRDGAAVTIDGGERAAGPFVLTLASEAEARLLTAMLGSAP